MMGVEDIGQLVECCSDACRTFQTSQENDSVIYCTWSAVSLDIYTPNIFSTVLTMSICLSADVPVSAWHNACLLLRNDTPDVANTGLLAR